MKIIFLNIFHTTTLNGHHSPAADHVIPIFSAAAAAMLRVTAGIPCGKRRQLTLLSTLLHLLAG